MRKTLLIALFSLLAACSKKQEEASSLVREIPVADAKQAAALTKEASLSCADSSQCPGNVGLFLATTTGSVLTCTAFLISEDTVATNSHCFPNVVKQLPDLCAERIQVIFPATSMKPEERFRCKELLGASARPNAISPDLALFRLESSTGRAPLLLSLGGVEPESLHLAYKINPGRGASGTLIAQSCKTIPGSYRFPLYRTAADPVFLTGDCPSLPGNSGAPLVNAKGEAVGAFQAELALSEMQRTAWTPHLLPGESFASLAMGTSLSCLGSSDWKWQPSCEPIDDESIRRPRIEDFASLESDALLRPALGSLPKIFQWKKITLSRRTLEKEESLAPSCFLSPENWIHSHAAPGGGLLQESQVAARLPVLLSKVFFNRYMQTTARSEITGYRQTAIRFRPFDLDRDGRSEASMEPSGDEVDSVVLEVCPRD